MLSDVQIAQDCNDIYTEARKFDRYFLKDRVFLGINYGPDYLQIIGRGTDNLLDGVRDLESAILKSTEAIGLVPFGFNIGVPECIDAILPIISDKPIYLGGHSLGAAHVAQIGGYLLAAGHPIKRLVQFGCPTPGGTRLKVLYEHTETVSYKNLNDLIPLVPILPSLCQLTDFTKVNEPADLDDDLGFLAPHRMKYYNRAIQKLFAENN